VVVYAVFTHECLHKHYEKLTFATQYEHCRVVARSTATVLLRNKLHCTYDSVHKQQHLAVNCTQYSTYMQYTYIVYTYSICVVDGVSPFCECVHQ
jgi:hypothetical protein